LAATFNRFRCAASSDRVRSRKGQLPINNHRCHLRLHQKWRYWTSGSSIDRSRNLLGHGLQECWYLIRHVTVMRKFLDFQWYNQRDIQLYYKVCSLSWRSRNGVRSKETQGATGIKMFIYNSTFALTTKSFMIRCNKNLVNTSNDTRCLAQYIYTK